MELEEFKKEIISLRDKLQTTATGMLMDRSEAEDAVQETFLRLWNNRSQLTQHPNPGGYAMQTLKNICIDKLRVSHTKILIDQVHIAENSTTPYTYTEQNDSLSSIHKIIESLPEIQRQVMILRDIEGYELEEIAQIMDAENSTIRVNLSRARKTVRDRLIGMNFKNN